MLRIGTLLLISTILLLGISCQKTENKSDIKIFANPETVEYLGRSYLSWGSTNVTDCKLNGIDVEPGGMIELLWLERDTSFTLTGKGLLGESLSSKANIKVGARSKYYDYLDTLCTGRWVNVQTRIFGFDKPNEWTIRNRDNIGDWSDGVTADENTWSIIFSKNPNYIDLIYKKYDTYYLMDAPFGVEVTKDLKKLKFADDRIDPGEDIAYDLVHLSNDSLVLYKKNQPITWAGSSGSGYGFFPVYTKYTHHEDLDKKIETNDTTTYHFRLLTSAPWKLDKVKFYFDGEYMYDEKLSDVVKNMNFYFFKDGVFAGYEDKTLREGPSRWYLFDNNTKIWRTGGYGELKIIKFESDSLVLSRHLRSLNTDPQGNWHYSTQEFYYIR